MYPELFSLSDFLRWQNKKKHFEISLAFKQNLFKVTDKGPSLESKRNALNSWFDFITANKLVMFPLSGKVIIAF